MEREPERASAHPGAAELSRAGATLAAVLAAILFLMGLAQGLRALWAQGWMGPETLVGGAWLAGVAGLAVGEALALKKLERAADAASAMAFITFYLATGAAHLSLGLLSAPLALALTAATAVVSAGLALRRDSEALAALAALGGLLGPALLGQAHGAAAVATLTLTAGVGLAVAVARRWSLLSATVAGALLLHQGALVLRGLVQPDGSGLAAAGLIGGLLAATAASRRTSDLSALLLAGVALLQLAALPWLSWATPSLGVATAVAALVLSLTLQAAGSARGWWMLSVVAAAMGSLALLPALGQGAMGAPALALLALLPGAVASGLHRSSDDPLEHLPAALTWVTCWLAAAWAAWQAQPAGLAVGISLLGVPGAWLVDTRWVEGRLAPRAAGGLSVAIALAGSAGLAWHLTEVEPRWTLVLSGAATVMALSPALALRGGGAWRWSPALLTPLALSPLLPALSALDATREGALVLLLSGIALTGLGLRQPAGERVAHLVLTGLGLLLAVSAVPLAWGQAAWTLGWAVQALVLAALARHQEPALLRPASLALWALVATRLLLNPGVLSVHLLPHPLASSWVIWTYGGAALLAAASAERLRPSPAAAALAGLAWLLTFAGLNLQLSVSHAGGLPLTTLDPTDGARLLRALLWGAFGALTLALPAGLPARVATPLGAGLLGLTLLKALLLDSWALSGLPRAALLVGLALCLVVTAAGLGRRAAAEEAR